MSGGAGGQRPVEWSFLASGGRTGEMIAELDWSTTPLGPIAGWPQSLRTAASICLASRHPMVIWWGPELVLIYNDAWVPILGPAKHPALGKPGELVWPEMWHIIGAQLRGVLDSGHATWSDDQLLPAMRHGYLEEAYFTYSYSPIRDENGGVAGVFTAVIETTDRVLNERRLRTVRELGDISAVTAPTVQGACDAALEVLALSRADIPFASIYLLGTEGVAQRAAFCGMVDDPRIVPTELDPDRDAEKPLWAVLNSKQPQVLTGLAADYPGLFTPTGSPMGDAPPDAAVAMPLATAGGGDPVGALFAGVNPYRALDADYHRFLDLVARQVATAIADAQTYQAQRQRAEALAELDQAKTEFFTGVSHELRTPLTLITAPAEDSLADTQDPLSPGQRTRVELIRRNSGRLRRLVDTLLDFARLEGGRLTPDRVAVDLAALTRGIAESFAPAITRAGLRATIDCPDLGDAVAVDVEMWEKIVLNLLSNAVKYTLAGEVTVTLRTSGDGGVELAVADTGIGIPAAELPLLFQRFHRVRGANGRSHEGSGIGLALVAELTGLHQGRVSVDSLPGAGSTFIVALPAAARTGIAPADTWACSAVELYREEALQWSGPDRDAPATAPLDVGPTAGATVLVAEDNLDLRRFVARLLEPHYRVLLAGDGRSALEQVRVDPPDLVLTDVMMPRLDGFGLLSALRADPATAAIPIILLSAQAGEEATGEGLAAGADDYLVKPFSSADLLARVRSNLTLARLRSQESAWRSALISAIQDGMYVADSDGTVVEVNDAFTGIVGYTAKDLPCVPPYPWWPDPVQEPEDFAQVHAAFTAALAGWHGRYVLPMRHGADRRRIWLSITWGTVTRPDGTVAALVATMRDVTAEHLSARRDVAVARLTGRLAGVSDSDGVLTTGLAELTANWATRRAMIVSWDLAGQGSVLGAGTSWAALSPATRASITRIHTTGRAHCQAGDRSVDPPRPTVAGAPIRSGTHTSVVWLELDPGRTFRDEDTALLSDLTGHLGQALTRARLFDEQRTASLTLQRAILGPTVLPAGFAVRYEPAVSHLSVGGDWYDIVELGGDRVGVAVGDCVGSGLPAAAVMGQLRTACRTLLLENHTPTQVLTALDRVAALIPAARCTTVFCAILDRGTGAVCYSCAGHLPAIIARAAGGTELLDDARGVPLATADVARRGAGAKLAPGDTVLLYTDGLVERRRRSLDDGIDSAREILAENYHLAPAAIAERLAAGLLSDGHDDDVAYLIYQHAGRPGRHSPAKSD
ncbi:MAG: PAS domain S-box protein [Pseudonocardiales bacterium]|nr:MAG: PAS domain S-box protein [Pseudonocardiales bacterium]